MRLTPWGRWGHGKDTTYHPAPFVRRMRPAPTCVPGEGPTSAYRHRAPAPLTPRPRLESQQLHPPPAQPDNPDGRRGSPHNLSANPVRTPCKAESAAELSSAAATTRFRGPRTAAQASGWATGPSARLRHPQQRRGRGQPAPPPAPTWTAAHSSRHASWSSPWPTRPARTRPLHP